MDFFREAMEVCDYATWSILSYF